MQAMSDAVTLSRSVFDLFDLLKCEKIWFPTVGGPPLKKLSREKLIGGKPQNLVWPFLLKNLFLCFSDASNFLFMKVQNWSSPTLAGVKLSLFCQFWQQRHVPQISKNVRCLGTSIGSPIKLHCPNLGNAMIEVGMKHFYNICPCRVTNQRPLRKQ